MLESTSVRTPKPAVKLIAFKSFVLRAIKSPVRNLLKKVGVMVKNAASIYFRLNAF